MTPEPAVEQVSGSRFSPPPWNRWTSNRRCAATAILFTLIIFLLTGGLDFFSEEYPQLRIPMLLGDLVVAVICGGLLFKLLQDAQRRQHSLMQRLELIAEMNHHIRNALEQIEFSAHATKDQQLRSNVDEAVSRIEWVLREILPREAGADS